MADAKRIVVLVGGLAVVAAGGWFAWQQFVTQPDEPAMVAAKPARPAASTMDKLIGEALASSGFTTYLQRLPEQIQTGFREGLKRRPPAGQNIAEVEKALGAAFSTAKFEKRVQTQLKKNFDQVKLEALVKDTKSPAVQRIVELEKMPPAADQMVAFAKALQSNPLPEERLTLLKRLESATGAGELSTEIMLASLKAMVQGAAGDKAPDGAALDKVIETQRTAAAEPMRNAAIINFAYTYRQASDADLGEYVKFYESEHGKWFTGQAHTALLDEFRSASGDLGKRLAEMAKDGIPSIKTASAGDRAAPTAAPGSAPAKAASAAPAAAQVPTAEPPAAPTQLTAARQAPAKPSRRGEDARNCLDQGVNEAVIKCAEAYR